MILFRIAKAEYANELFASGRANRWNAKGDEVIYTSTTRSLATLELLVHRVGIGLVANQFKVMLVEVDSAATTKTVDVDSLTKKWRTMRGYTECQKIGHDWAEKREHLLLEVPSAVVPQEKNFVINTEHPDFKKQVKLVGLEAYAFDRRLV